MPERVWQPGVVAGGTLDGALGDPRHWSDYNQAVMGRGVRQLCLDLLHRAGPGAGRRAIDLGCGTGTETKALLDAGWNVLAIDGSPATRELVADTVGPVEPGRLIVRVVDIESLTELPVTDLLFSSLTLPFVTPSDFERVWRMVRASLAPEGWLAVNLFGERDSWAPSAAATFLTAENARRLMDGLVEVSFEEREEDRPAFQQAVKHWHVFEVIARRGPG